MWGILRVLLAVPLLVGALTPAFAGCVFGNTSIPGSIGPGQRDASRTFTVDGTAIITVAAATHVRGEPVELHVSFPGHCQERVGPTVSCTVRGRGVVNAVIVNPGWRQAIYAWVCTSLP